MTTVKVGMKVGPSTRKALFVLGKGKNRIPSTRKAVFVLRKGRELIPEAEGRQGLQTRTPSSDGEPLPRGEGFGVGVTWAPVGAVQKKTPKSDRTQGSSKNRGYLLSHLVGQYHRRW